MDAGFVFLDVNPERRTKVFQTNLLLFVFPWRSNNCKYYPVIFHGEKLGTALLCPQATVKMEAVLAESGVIYSNMLDQIKFIRPWQRED